MKDLIKTIYDFYICLAVPLLAIGMCVILYGCSPIDIAKGVMGQKPSVEASLEVSKGKNEEINTNVGGTKIEAETASMDTTNYGFDVQDLAILLGVLVALGLPASYFFYHLGLRTPRPTKYRRFKNGN